MTRNCTLWRDSLASRILKTFKDYSWKGYSKNKKGLDMARRNSFSVWQDIQDNGELLLTVVDNTVTEPCRVIRSRNFGKSYR